MDRRNGWSRMRLWGVFCLMVTVFVLLVSLQGQTTRGYISVMEKKLAGGTGEEAHPEKRQNGAAGGEGQLRDGETEPNAAASPAREKIAYLTFDDGPSSLTGQYLDILKKHQVQATFFLIGNQAEENPELVRREIAEGHEVGIHTYTHDSCQIYQSADTYEQDVDRVKDILEQDFGYIPKLWRFPWGSANCYIYSFKQDIIGRLQGKGLDYADWNVSAEDSIGYPTASSILANVRKDCFRYDEPVVLMHDSGSNQATLDSLEAVISLFQENGYVFGTVSERKGSCHFGEY